MLLREFVQIAHAFGTGQQPRMRLARQQRVHARPAADRRLRHEAPISRDRLDFGAGFAQSGRRAIRGRRRRARSARACLRASPRRATRSIAANSAFGVEACRSSSATDGGLITLIRRRRDAVARQRLHAARPDYADRQRVRPDRSRCGRTRDRPHSATRTPPAHSARSEAERRAQRRVVGNRGDVDQREFERGDAGGRELRDQLVRLTGRSRNHDRERRLADGRGLRCPGYRPPSLAGRRAVRAPSADAAQDRWPCSARGRCPSRLAASSALATSWPSASARSTVGAGADACALKHTLAVGRGDDAAQMQRAVVPVSRRPRAALRNCRRARATPCAPLRRPLPYVRDAAARAMQRGPRDRRESRCRARPARQRASCLRGSSSARMRSPRPSRFKPAAARMIAA